MSTTIATPLVGSIVANPLASPLFPSLLAILAGAFGGGLVLIGLVQRGSSVRLSENVLFRRWLSWLLIAPVYALAVLGGSITTGILVALLVVQGSREYARLVGLPRRYAGVLPAAGLLIVGAAAVSREVFLGIAPLLALVATLPALVTRDVEGGTRRTAFTVLGLAYLPLALAQLVLIGRIPDHGPGLLLVLGFAVALSDVGAFVAGRLFGRRKLAPVLSPNKTWGGVIGNVVGAYVGCALLQFALPVAPRPLLLATLPLVIAIGAVWGDLLESLMKREVGAKGAGTWLPGMGGLLDRIDSLLVVAPLTYAYLSIVL